MAGIGQILANPGPGIIRPGLVFYVDAGLSASYPGSGTTWTDLSGNSNSGTLTNGPTFSSANNGQIVFDGTNDSVLCTNNASVQITVGSIGVWVKATNTNTNYRGILLKQFAWSLFVKNNVLISYDWGNNLDRSTGITIGNNTWNFVVMTFTETVGTPSNNARIYRNGSLVLTTTVKHNAQTQSLQVGADAVSNQYLSGSISSAFVYNRVLSADEITQNFNANRGRHGI